MVTVNGQVINCDLIMFIFFRCYFNRIRIYLHWISKKLMLLSYDPFETEFKAFLC